jgi:hypothetical protein
MLVTIPNAGQFGVIRDALPHELPVGAWSEGRNVRFGDGYVERMKGHQALYGTPSVTPYVVQPYYSGSTRFWLYGGASKLYSVTGSTHTDITRAVGGDYTATPNVWTANVMGGIAYLNNPTDKPQFWAGSGSAADLTNWDANLRCKSLRNFKYTLIAMNCTESGTNYPHMIRTSHPAEPGSVPSSWDYTDAAKDCYRNNLSATPDHLIDGMAMGNDFYLYKESSVYRLSYIGAPDIFRLSDPISTQAGALAVNCIAEFPGGHMVLGQSDIFINNGAQVQSAITGRMRRWLQANLDSQWYQRSFLTSLPTRSEIWVCIPMTGSEVPNMALVWNWETNTWTFRELPDVYHATSGVIDAVAASSIDAMTEAIDTYTDPINYTDYTQAAQRMVMASSELYLADSTRLFDGSNFSAYVVREGLSFPEVGLGPDRMKLIKEIRPRIDGSGTVFISVGGKNDVNTATTWGTAQPFTIGSSLKVDVLQSWRYPAIKFESNTQGAWRLRSLDLEVVDAGAY